MMQIRKIYPVSFCLVAMGAWSPAAQAQRFDLETAIIDSTTSRAIGGGKKSGEINAFFTAQKEMVYGALNDLGIPLDTLPADVRKNLERFHTTNFAAFRMFSLGLNAQDEGKFAEAKAFFEKAVELDPDFELAGKLGVSMPSTNVIGAAQLQAVLAGAAKTTASTGKTLVEVDLAGAIAAIQSGMTVVVGAKSDLNPTDGSTAKANNSYTSNPAGSGANYAARKVVGSAYSVQSGVSVASTNEWTLDQVDVDRQGLIGVGDTTTFQANRSGAVNKIIGSFYLSDDTTVSWGTWGSESGGGFKVSSKGTPIPNVVGPFQYMIGEATRAMPVSGSATFVPAGGFLKNVTGTIGVDFFKGTVRLNSLGFDIGTTTYSNLSGEAGYGSRDASGIFKSAVASGFFKGNYTAGSCSGCTAFSPTASVFTGNFLGKNASGLMFSTVMSTGNGTASGLHTFSKAP